jgi:hypothetical protein
MASASPVVESVASGSDFLTLRVRASSRDIASAASPSGPRTTGFLIAVPPGAAPRLVVREDRWRAAEALPLPGVDYPREVVRLKERARAGDLDLVRIELAPLTATAAGDRLDFHEEVVLDVLLSAAALAPGPVAGGLRARAPVPGRGAPPAGWSREPEPQGSADPVRLAVLSSIANPEQASVFAPRARERRSEPRGAGFTASGCVNCVKVAVREDGLYRVRFLDLVGFPGFAGQDPRDLHVYLRGVEVPIDVDGEDDGVFGGADAIVFAGERNTGRYGDTTVYWIVPPDGTRGLRVRERPAFGPGDAALPSRAVVLGKLRFEEQARLHDRMPDAEDRDAWMTALLVSTGASGQVARLPFSAAGLDLPDLTRAAPGRSYRLRAHFFGRTSSLTVDEQLVTVSVNDVAQGLLRWRASLGLEQTVDLEYDPATLAQGGNHVQLQQLPPDPGLYRVNFLDWVEADYPRRLLAAGGVIDYSDDTGSGVVYHVGGFASPAVRIYLVAGGETYRILRPQVLSLGPGQPMTLAFAWRGAASDPVRVRMVEESALRSPVSITRDVASDLATLDGAEYLVVAHPRFAAEAARLAAYRGGMVVDLTDIHDEFNHGMENSGSVRDFLRSAVSSWRVPPRYVALVGDASFDPRNYQGLAAPDYDPPSLLHARDIQIDSTPGLRAASDNWFAEIDPDDFLPDVAIGRLPVRAVGELDAYLDKIRAYETQPAAPWMDRIQLFADDDITGDGSECGIAGAVAADFEASVGRWLPAASPANLLRRYAGSYTGVFAPQDLQTDVVADLVDGVGIQLYSGHGNLITLARHCQAGGYSIFDTDTLPRVTNGDRQALGVAMTCDAGDFDYAGVFGGSAVTQSISEKYLLAPDRGHIAWIAATTIQLYSTGAGLTDAVIASLYGPGPGAPANRIVGSLGVSVVLRHFADLGGAARDGVETTVVLGDPALRLVAGTP